jgi:hypothetical protein
MVVKIDLKSLVGHKKCPQDFFSNMIHELKRLSENSEKCHCEAFFAEACFLGSQSPLIIRGDCFVAKNAPRNDNQKLVVPGSWLRNIYHERFLIVNPGP